MLADYFRNMKGQSFNPMRVMFGAVSDIVTGITLGQRYDYSDPKLQQLNDYTHEFVHNCVFILDIMPWVRILPTIKKKIAIGRNAFDLYMDLMKAEVEKSLKSDEDSFVRQYVEAKGGEYDREQLNFIVRDLLMAGTDTTANSMLWGLIILANNPDVQRQLRQEVDLVVPKTRLPSLNDRQHLPFTEASIAELLRWKTIIPVTLPRVAQHDLEVNGYFIPAGTQVRIAPG